MGNGVFSHFSFEGCWARLTWIHVLVTVTVSMALSMTASMTMTIALSSLFHPLSWRSTLYVRDIYDLKMSATRGHRA